MNVSFEPMTAGHEADVMEIYNWFVENSFAAYPEKRVPSVYYSRFLEMTKGFPAYVMISNGIVSGFCFLHPYNPHSSFRDTAEITYFIRQECTGKGFGRMALEKLEKEASDMGIRNILASISSENAQSLAFHRRNGFTECGRLPGIGKKLGRYFDVVWMVKKLV